MRRQALPLAVTVAAFVSPLAAQPVPHLGYLYPAGGRQGAIVQVRAGGQFLNGASRAYISGDGVEIKEVQFIKPPTGPEIQFMREEMQKLNQKRAASFKRPAAGTPKVVFTAADQRRVDELRDKLEENQRRPYIPAIVDKVLLQIAIAPDATVGPRKLRLETPNGVTNPIVFSVGDLPEFSRTPTRVGPLYNVINGGVPIIRTLPRQPDPPTEITLPIVVNGQMMPGVADRYRFRAAKGQHLVIAVEARKLMPYLSDAVPGWFQAAITLRDAAGKQLASADHFLFHPDPLLEYDIPGNGEYVAEIHDSIYRGREDFVYRMSIGELPVITSVFPLGAKTGTRASVTTYGWNLPAPRGKENFKGKSEGLHPVFRRKNNLVSNPVPFVLDSLPETMAKRGIVRQGKAQRVKLPVIVNGRVERPGEAAFFRFNGRAGEEIVAEVTARRLGSPVDSLLRLTDASGRELASNDDFEDKAAGLITHQADSLLSCKLPAKGTYYLQLADVQHNGGPEYGYRLRISHPRPDFELRVVPSSFNLRSGATVPFTVYALRRDGFGGEIALNLKDAPADFRLSGAAVPAGQDKVRVTLTAPRNRAGLPQSIQLAGQARIEGREVTRIAVPAEDMEQAFAYRHLVAEDAWMVRIIGTGMSGMPWRPVEKRVALRPGAATPLQLFLPYRPQPGIQFALSDGPEGISIQRVTPERNGVSVVLGIRPEKVKPGLKGNLILEAFREVPNRAAGNRLRRQPMGILPAVPFEVVARQSR